METTYELLGYVIGHVFLNGEDLLRSNGEFSSHPRAVKLFKTEESAKRYCVKHVLEDVYVRKYIREKYTGSTICKTH